MSVTEPGTVIHIGTEFVTTIGVLDDQGNIISRETIPGNIDRLHPESFIEAANNALTQMKRLESRINAQKRAMEMQRQAQERQMERQILEKINAAPPISGFPPQPDNVSPQE